MCIGSRLSTLSSVVMISVVPSSWRTVGTPEFPCMHVHHGFGIQRLHIKVVRITTGDGTHGSGVCRQNRDSTLRIERLRIRVR